MKTYAQWIKSEQQRIFSEYGEKISIKEMKSQSHRPTDWHKQEIMPKIKDGERISLAMCRSIAKFGGGYSLEQFQKYHNCIPEYVLFSTGKIVQKSY